MWRARLLLSLSLLFCVHPLAAAHQNSVAAETVAVNVKAAARPFPHFWERMFGSGRATLSLRDSYRQDLRAVKGITGFEYLRFHGIFDDDVGVYSEDKSGKPDYNFSYVDQIYDGLLANGVRPYVEISFMPRQLAAAPVVLHPFWYHPITSPPKDWSRWDDLIEQFARHLVARYGIDEVSHWYFEVWNEPNIDFWSGDPKQSTYYELYDHTARDIKRVSARLRVGGPSTAQAAWVDSFIKHDVENKVPVDFISTHVYGNDTAANVFGTDENIPRDRMVCRAAKKVHDEVLASARPKLPIIFSEYNASYANEPDVTDSIFMGPWLANTIRQCDGLVDILSYWTFSDVFEEQGVIKKPLYGGFGLVAEGGVPKPSFNAFRLLHMLGTKRIPVDSDSVLATRSADGSLVLAAWNYSAPERPGAAKKITLQFNGLKGGERATIYVLDEDHGDALGAYASMDSPANPTQKQYEILKAAANLGAPEERSLKNGRITLTLPAKALDVVVIR
ncbi:MAG: GH39 family glycosyl hydrolase [Candidatus Acidiferrales bacterium]